MSVEILLSSPALRTNVVSITRIDTSMLFLRLTLTRFVIALLINETPYKLMETLLVSTYVCVTTGEVMSESSFAWRTSLQALPDHPVFRLPQIGIGPAGTGHEDRATDLPYTHSFLLDVTFAARSCAEPSCPRSCCRRVRAD